MGVDWSCQTIMQKVLFLDHTRTEINRLHHATRCQDAKKGVEVRLIRDLSGFQGDREGLRTIHFKIESLSVEKKNDLLMEWISTELLGT